MGISLLRARLMWLSLSIVQGACGTSVAYQGPTLEANPVPRVVRYERARPRGPLADADSSSIARSARFLLDRRADEIARGLFAGIAEEEECWRGVERLAACADRAACEDDLAFVDECLALAAISPGVGPAFVSSAVGRGALLSSEAGRSCATDVVAFVDAVAGLELSGELFSPLPHDSRGACEKALATLVADREKSCGRRNVYEVDECLALFAATSDEKARVVQALTGRGTFASKGCAFFDSETSASDDATAIQVRGPWNVTAPCKKLNEKLGVTPSKATCGQIPKDAFRALDYCSVAGQVDLGLWSKRYGATYDYVLVTGWVDEPLRGAGGSSQAALPPSSLESAIVNGLADFLAKRARAEVLDHLAKLFGDAICEHQARDVRVRTFFPETCHLLKGRGGEQPASLAQLGSALQKALEHDVRALLPSVLNLATAGLGGGRWGDTAEKLLALAVLAIDGKPPTLRKLLEHGSSTIPCDGAGDYGCALRFLCVAALAADETRAKTPCTTGEAPDCLKQAVKALETKLGADAQLAKWVAAHDHGDRDALVRALLDRLASIAAEVNAGELPLSQLAALLRTGVDRFIPVRDRDRAHELVGKLENHIAGWGELAYAVFQVAQAILHGQDPRAVLIAAARQSPCRSKDDDLGCGVRAAGHLLDALLATRAKWPGEAGGVVNKLIAGSETGDPATYLASLHKRIRSDLDRAGNETLREWVKARFGSIDKLHVGGGRAIPIDDALGRLLADLRALERAIDQASRAGRQERAGAVADMITAATNLFRTVIDISVRAERPRARALRILDRIAEASAALGARELATFMASLYSLAVDLGVPDPLPERVRRYVPLVTALATARTADQVSAALEKYAAPVGGYKVKRTAGAHVTVSALVGFGGGAERGTGIDWAGHATVLTPVGFDLTWGACHGCGLMVSLIDLGALTASRISDEPDADVTNVDPTFAHVFSPGIYLRAPQIDFLGPVVLGAGISAVPGLRRDANGESEPIFRGVVFVAVDVTMFPL